MAQLVMVLASAEKVASERWRRKGGRSRGLGQWEHLVGASWWGWEFPVDGLSENRASPDASLARNEMPGLDYFGARQTPGSKAASVKNLTR